MSDVDEYGYIRTTDAAGGPVDLRGIQVTGSGTAVVSGGVVVVLRPVS